MNDQSDADIANHECPECGCSRFKPVVGAEVGALYYFIGQCSHCSLELQCCPRCRAWMERRYGENTCKYCGQKYFMPTIEEEKQALKNGSKNFLHRGSNKSCI